MTSIIGYTRVPFNSSASKHFSIAPVKRLYLTESPDNEAQSNFDFSRSDENKFKGTNEDHTNNKGDTRRPSFHRIFSRETSQHGIMELIIDKNRGVLNDNSARRASATEINTPQYNRVKSAPALSTKNGSNISKNYNIYLSIDLSGSHDYDGISIGTENTGYDDIQKLMDSISKIAQEKTIHFVNVLNLLKGLQLQQEYHRFMSCIDKLNEKIYIYFPCTVSSTAVDQVYIWIKDTIGVDINKFKQWKLSFVEEAQVFQDIGNNTTVVEGQIETKKDLFDGEQYFNDIHMFINHVDSLIESNGLFSHRKNQNQ